MSLSFYSASVSSYLQTLKATASVLEKGREHAAAQSQTTDDLLQLTLRDDMNPLPFQVISVWHHSMGAIKGMQSGEFGPPPSLGDLDYAGLEALVAEAIEFLQSQSKDDINGLSDGKIVFKMGKLEMPFTNNNFLMSFSLPNFYFHATTTYGLLRHHGVALGKVDFLGPMRVGH